jgi:hypothetical protein
MKLKSNADSFSPHRDLKGNTNSRNTEVSCKSFAVSVTSKPTIPDLISFVNSAKKTICSQFNDFMHVRKPIIFDKPNVCLSPSANQSLCVLRLSESACCAGGQILPDT